MFTTITVIPTTTQVMKNLRKSQIIIIKNSFLHIFNIDVVDIGIFFPYILEHLSDIF